MLRKIGIGSDHQEIFLFYQQAKTGRKQIYSAKSLNGLTFSPVETLLEFEGDSGKLSKGAIRSLRITPVQGGFFHTFIVEHLMKRQLYYCVSADQLHWKFIRPISGIHEATVMVPGIEFEENNVIFTGERDIRIGFGNSPKNWKILKEPIISPRDNSFDNSALEVGQARVVEEGILLTYYTHYKNGKTDRLAMGAALFDKQNPTRLLWRSDDPIWQQPDKWKNKKLSALGEAIFQNKFFFFAQDSQDESIFTVSLLIGDKPAEELVRQFRPRLEKSSNNPIVGPRPQNHWESKAVFNPAAIYLDNRVHLIYRAIGGDDISRFGYIASGDGFETFERLHSPVYEHNAKQSSFTIYSFESGGSFGGSEDPRLVRVGNEDVIYMTYTACDEGLRMALTSIKIEDFLKKEWHWTPPRLISAPGEIHKNWVIFPEKINGKYAILHSINPQISVAYLDDLEFNDGGYIDSSFTNEGRRDYWDNWMRGVGPPPIKTEYGWLLLYHAMDKSDWGKYKLGAMILDLIEPTKLICRSPEPILEPTEHYENDGFKAGVAYVSGAVVKDDQLCLYYGGADTVICAAKAYLPEFLEQLLKHQPLQLAPLAPSIY